jgi:hypothetical protein
MSRRENALTLHEVIRTTYAMVDVYCASYPRSPASVTLDMDDTVDVVRGFEQVGHGIGLVGISSLSTQNIYFV